MKLFHWLKRIIFIVLVAELFYVLVFNAALNIPQTQTLINKIKPEKFQVHWEKAWTIYPFAIQVEKISANGETSSSKWKVDVKKAIASISLLPLLRHKVNVYDVAGTDIAYAQQRKHKMNADRSGDSPSAASVSGNEVNNTVAMAEKKSKKKKPWHITVRNAIIKGHHSFTIDKIKGDLDGDLSADVSIETKSGPFAISDGKADITLNTLEIGDGQMVLKESTINGKVEISPVIFKENKGVKILKFLTLDTDIKAQMGNLDFLDIYLHSIEEMQLDGKGLLSGHINFDKGVLLSGTELKVDADELSVAMLDHEVKGNGEVELNVVSAKPDELNVKVLFDDLQAYYNTAEEAKRGTPLFSGKGLLVEAKGVPSLFPKASKDKKVTYLGIEIPPVKVEDLGQYQRYIPEKWHFKLYGGEGTLKAKANLLVNSFKSKVQVQSTAADIGIDKNRFQSDLDLLLNLDADYAQKLKVDLSGSYLSLSDSRLFNQKKSDKRKSKPWDTKLNINKGTLTIPLPDLRQDANSTQKLSKEERAAKMKERMAQADAKLKISGSISQLDWINLLLKNSLGLSLWGQGDIKGNLELEKGSLLKGSALEIKSKELGVHLLDYSFSGDGAFSAEVTKGGENPDARFDVSLSHAKMKRQNEKQALIDSVVLKLDGVGKNLGIEGVKNDIALHLQIPSARVKKVSLYNQFLPKDSPFSFAGGSANLNADIRLEPNTAKGYLNFATSGLTMKADDQKISARLNAKIKLAGGEPRNMKFDISGSTITLDQAKVVGKKARYSKKDWSAIVKVKRANVVWRMPVWLKSETELTIKDSRPIVAMMDNKRDKHGLISKLLTIENIHGMANINMANNTITIPNAYVKSDKIDIGAKGIISPKLHDGMFLFRFKKLKGLLKIRNGKKNFDILYVQKTFDNYVIPFVRK